jgi:hypothetical protein
MAKVIFRAKHLPVVSLLTVCGCDTTVLTTQAGKHVVYHWDAAQLAADDEHLCGGTVGAADQLLEAISAHYGWTLSNKGPSVDYFLGRQLVPSSCPESSQCARSGRVVFTSIPFDSHELAHTSRGGHKSPSFIYEAFASRWETVLVDFGPPYLTSPAFFTEAQLRAWLEVSTLQDSTRLDYRQAMTWLVALESTFGPAKVGEFIEQLGWWSSPDDVDQALQQVFGISLAESAALAENLPEGTLDDPVCEFLNLPTWELSGDPGDSILVERPDAHCNDNDLISIHGDLASWLFAIELPEDTLKYYVEVTAPGIVELDRQLVTLATCNGSFDADWLPYVILSPEYSHPMTLQGRQVGALIAEIAPDGTVQLPRVSFEVLP